MVWVKKLSECIYHMASYKPATHDSKLAKVKVRVQVINLVFVNLISHISMVQK